MQHSSYVLEAFLGALHAEAHNQVLRGGSRVAVRESDEWFEEFKESKLRPVNDGMQMLHGVLTFMFLTNRVLPRLVPQDNRGASQVQPLKEMSGDAVHKYMQYLEELLDDMRVDVAASHIVKNAAGGWNTHILQREASKLTEAQELVVRLKALAKPLVRCLDFKEVSEQCMRNLGTRAGQESVLYLTVAETQGAVVAIADASATRLPRWV